MRRERNPQTQNRMVFRNRDHREIIMEDQYHGAVYIDDEPEPAWRKYKPKLLSMDIGEYDITYDGAVRHLGGCLISFDVKNKYVSFANHLSTRSQARSYKLGNVLYKQEGSYGYASINGYDWKAKQVTFSDLSNNPTIYQYGKYLMAYGSNSYNFYEIDYNEGNAEFSGPTIVKQISSFPFSWQKYLGHVDTDEYQGAFFFYGNTVASFGAGLTSYKNVSVKLSLGLDMEYQDVFTYTGSNYDSCTVSNVFNVNQRYVFFIRYFRFTSWSSSNVSSNIYGRTSILYSDPGDPTSWHEIAVTPERLFIQRVDNLSNRIYDHIQIGHLDGITMIYKNSTYYLYMNKTTAVYSPYTIYYLRNNQKVIIGYDQDGTDYERMTVYVSSDLDHWEEYTLPQYIDVPFYNDSDLAENNGRHGGYLKENTNYSGVRFFLDGNLMKNPITPSGMLLSDPYNGISSNQYVPRLFYSLIDDEIIDGQIQRICDSEDEDIWICRLIYSYNSSYQYDYYRWIAVRFTDPLFRAGDAEVYLLEQANPPNQSASNVDPISEEDYIFDT